jgi:hypothetical protein
VNHRKCAACGNADPVERDLCGHCFRALPNVTRTMYKAKRIDTRRAVESLRLRYVSVKVLRGGRHTR